MLTMSNLIFGHQILDYATFRHSSMSTFKMAFSDISLGDMI